MKTVITFTTIVGLLFGVTFSLVSYRKSETSTIGTVVGVDYKQASFGSAEKTVVTFSDGRVIPFRGHSSLRVGKTLKIVSNRHGCITSYEIYRGE